MKKTPLGVLVILVAVTMVLSISATASEADVTVTEVTVSPESVEVGENVTITATVKNTGNTTENVTVVFKVNEEEVKSANVTVEANATETVECAVAEDEAGTYNVTVDNKSASFTVTAPTTPTPTPTTSPTATITPTPATPVPATPVPSEEKFRVGPTVRLRPVVDVIEKGQDGLVELYIDNPSLNDVVLHMEAHVSVPSGLHIYSEQYAWATAAGVAYAPAIEIPPGTVRTISLAVKADENARLGSHTLHFSGLYYPGNNKDFYNPISLTYPITVKEASMKATPAPGETPAPIIPGFEAVFAIAGLLAIAYLVRRKK